MGRKTNKKNPYILTIIVSSVVAILLAIVIVANVLLLGPFESIITSYLSTQKLGSEARQEGENLAQQIMEEGIVLTKNEENTLPLNRAENKKVNVFGWASTNWVQAGSGSGRTVTANGKLNVETDLLSALESAGIEYNKDLAKMYETYQASSPYWGTGSLNCYNHQYSRLYEPSMQDTTCYSDELLANCEAFSDTAFVVLSRMNGESNDAPMAQYKAKGNNVIATDESRTYMDISTEEEELLTYVGSKYNKVVVIINSANTMNLSFLDTIGGLDSCVIVGYTGQKAASAIPNVLYEDTSDTTWKQVTPSGRTVDTYVRNFSTTASYVNSGEKGISLYKGTNPSLYPLTTTNPNVGTKPKYDGVSYLDYQEGIYVGYKWFETADAEGFWDSQAAKTAWGISNGYKDVVQYPFGYGLSYTNFEWTVRDGGLKVKDLAGGDKEYTLTVSVENVGKYPGRDVVELYFTPPYSGGIEKSAVNLCAFAKTQSLLKPSETEDVKLTFKLSDLASYDYNDANSNGFAGYEVEKGAYVVSLRTDAHTLATEKLAKYSNAEMTINIESTVKFENDPVTGNVVKNLFTADDAVDGISLDGSEESVPVKYMTRSDFENTFPFEKVAARAITEKCIATNKYQDSHVNAYNEAFTTANPDATMPVNGSRETGYKLFDGKNKLTETGYQLGTDYNDPLWEDVLNQITASEMTKLVLHGYIHEEAISSIGKERTGSLDGPNQVGSFNASSAGTGFPCTTTAAQSWNDQLIYSQGLAMGAEARNMNLNGIYAPGVNIHRSAFGGRNYEYFSEDSYLSGVLCSKFVEGAKNAGVYTYIKHFVLYDQETNRDSIYVWVTEQALREIYLKPSKIAVDNGAVGLMSSYGRIGAIWTGGSQALLTNLLRDEWNFYGTVITDYADHQDFMNGDQMVRAGGDLWMDGYESNGAFRKETSSVAYWTAMRTATKHIVYMYANTLATAQDYDPTKDSISVTIRENSSTFDWKATTKMVTAGIVVCLLICETVAVVLPILKVKKLKKQQADGNSENA